MKEMFFISLLVLFSCGQDLTRNPGARTDSTSFSSLTCSCSDYSSPVCGYNGTQYVTFLNGCIAQCNGFSYTSGACTTQASTSCNSNSGQVCGIPACPTGSNCQGAGLYNNQCTLVNSGATQVEMRQCTSL